MRPTPQVADWLLDSDPSIRWQVLRDLLDAPEPQWSIERDRVATEGWGARLLSHQDPDGQWARGAFFPADLTRELYEAEGQPWTATAWSLAQLREFGLPPDSEPARRTVELVGANARWDHDGQPYWEGEVEECINGRTVADGAYFGVDVSPIVERILGERMADGGWNCERERGSTRSSFDSTINVLEGLLEYESAGHGTPATRLARESGEEYLLRRGLFRRLTTGEPADADYLAAHYPTRWRYDVLRALDHFRAASRLTGTPPDDRLSDAIDLLRARQSDDDTWPLDGTPRGRVWFSIEETGRPSRWITLRAARVLRWWDEKS
ncbi:MAG TPA: squalene cyclase [Stackebrandtia sp.]|jgi:hypothetical protein|uniref:squalene cyclase n=1 Tax=Stackebrandtia sp. TaxID=2023065 RepID=UPI002D579526|nr:squalene cyclase [Stackebrandtia sp.]HZE39776.1 squalene cyclase [Stackebrandtia sp.]